MMTYISIYVHVLSACPYKYTEYSQLRDVLVLSLITCMYVYMRALYARRCKYTDSSR